jgi:aminoglycoside phosphotransferase (APT) family kinase protein
VGAERLNQVLRQRPPARALRWAADAIGPGSRIASVRAIRVGRWHANHALDVVDADGTRHRLVLRRWARPEWAVDDPDFTAAREAVVLELLSGSPVPAPRLVAADPEGAACDVPTLLLTRLSGSPPGLSRDLRPFLTQLAEALVPVHALDGRARELLPGYRSYHDVRSIKPPPWSTQSSLWGRAIEIASADPPPGRRCFIHRDYQPENTLWSCGRLTGIVDWTTGCWGPAAVDTAHMRWNLALTYGLDAAKEFLRLHRAFAPGASDDQRYWDVVTVLDLVCDLDSSDWSSFNLARLERYLASVLVRRRDVG